MCIRIVRLLRTTCEVLMWRGSGTPHIVPRFPLTIFGGEYRPSITATTFVYRLRLSVFQCIEGQYWLVGRGAHHVERPPHFIGRRPFVRRCRRHTFDAAVLVVIHLADAVEDFAVERVRAQAVIPAHSSTSNRHASQRSQNRWSRHPNVKRRHKMQRGERSHFERRTGICLLDGQISQPARAFQSLQADVFRLPTALVRLTPEATGSSLFGSSAFVMHLSTSPSSSASFRPCGRRQTAWWLTGISP